MDALIGAWHLLDWQHRTADGLVTWPYGPAAVGRILYAGDGVMGGFLLHPDRAAASLAGGFLSYSARYVVADDIVSHHIDIASLPEWHGLVLRRRVALSGDRLVLTSIDPPAAGVHRLAFRRAGPSDQGGVTSINSLPKLPPE